jgi:hypothetical protein
VTRLRLPWMERVVLVAELRPETLDRALELVDEQAGQAPVTDRQGVFLSDSVVVFFFEGPDAEEAVREILNDPVRSTAVSPWLPLFSGPLHHAREAEFFERDGG